MLPRILLIESEPAAIEAVKGMLCGFCVEICTCIDPDRALEQVRATRPELILLRTELPRTSGYAICNKLRKDDELRQIPLVITSSKGDQKVFRQHKRLRTRADAYLRMPLRLDTLTEVLGSLIPLEPVVSAGSPEGAGPQADAQGVEVRLDSGEFRDYAKDAQQQEIEEPESSGVLGEEAMVPEEAEPRADDPVASLSLTGVDFMDPEELPGEERGLVDLDRLHAIQDLSWESRPGEPGPQTDAKDGAPVEPTPQEEGRLISFLADELLGEDLPALSEPDLSSVLESRSRSAAERVATPGTRVRPCPRSDSRLEAIRDARRSSSPSREIPRIPEARVDTPATDLIPWMEQVRGRLEESERERELLHQELEALHETRSNSDQQILELGLRLKETQDASGAANEEMRQALSELHQELEALRQASAKREEELLQKLRARPQETDPDG